MRFLIPALVGLVLSAPACAQVAPPTFKNNLGKTVEGIGTFCPDAYKCATSPRESFQLVSNNVPLSQVTVFGGDYVLSQTCASYGTLSVQVRGPDGVTFITMFSKTASDTGNATGIVLGSYAVIKISVSGTSGCNALLARVPS